MAEYASAPQPPIHSIDVQGEWDGLPENYARLTIELKVTPVPNGRLPLLDFDDESVGDVFHTRPIQEDNNRNAHSAPWSYRHPDERTGMENPCAQRHEKTRTDPLSVDDNGRSKLTTKVEIVETERLTRHYPYATVCHQHFPLRDRQAACLEAQEALVSEIEKRHGNPPEPRPYKELKKSLITYDSYNRYNQFEKGGTIGWRPPHILPESDLKELSEMLPQQLKEYKKDDLVPKPYAQLKKTLVLFEGGKQGPTKRRLFPPSPQQNSHEEAHYKTPPQSHAVVSEDHVANVQNQDGESLNRPTNGDVSMEALPSCSVAGLDLSPKKKRPGTEEEDIIRREFSTQTAILSSNSSGEDVNSPSERLDTDSIEFPSSRPSPFGVPGKYTRRTSSEIQSASKIPVRKTKSSDSSASGHHINTQVAQNDTVSPLYCGTGRDGPLSGVATEENIEQSPSPTPQSRSNSVITKRQDMKRRESEITPVRPETVDAEYLLRHSYSCTPTKRGNAHAPEAAFRDPRDLAREDADFTSSAREALIAPFSDSKAKQRDIAFEQALRGPVYRQSPAAESNGYDAYGGRQKAPVSTLPSREEMPPQVPEESKHEMLDTQIQENNVADEHLGIHKTTHQQTSPSGRAKKVSRLVPRSPKLVKVNGRLYLLFPECPTAGTLTMKLSVQIRLGPEDSDGWRLLTIPGLPIEKNGGLGTAQFKVHTPGKRIMQFDTSGLENPKYHDNEIFAKFDLASGFALPMKMTQLTRQNVVSGLEMPYHIQVANLLQLAQGYCVMEYRAACRLNLKPENFWADEVTFTVVINDAPEGDSVWEIGPNKSNYEIPPAQIGQARIKITCPKECIEDPFTMVWRGVYDNSQVATVVPKLFCVKPGSEVFDEAPELRSTLKTLQFAMDQRAKQRPSDVSNSEHREAMREDITQALRLLNPLCHKAILEYLSQWNLGRHVNEWIRARCKRLDELYEAELQAQVGWACGKESGGTYEGGLRSQLGGQKIHWHGTKSNRRTSNQWLRSLVRTAFWACLATIVVYLVMYGRSNNGLLESKANQEIDEEITITHSSRLLNASDTQIKTEALVTETVTARLHVIPPGGHIVLPFGEPGPKIAKDEELKCDPPTFRDCLDTLLGWRPPA